VKVSDTVSSKTKGACDVDFDPSRACAALFYRSLSETYLVKCKRDRACDPPWPPLAAEARPVFILDLVNALVNNVFVISIIG